MRISDWSSDVCSSDLLGYESAHHGEGRWNGVAILSRVGLDDVVDGFADDDGPDPEARLITATCGGVRVMSAYVPNGRARSEARWGGQEGVSTWRYRGRP